jgi:hypothetical protein
MKGFAQFWILSFAMLFALNGVDAFSSTLIFASTHSVQRTATFPFQRTALKNTSSQEDSTGENVSSEVDAKKSLEEKMKGWEASEEEIKASSLGGVTPGRTDAFDIGLYIAFPFMILGSLAFALFPFIMDKIDVSSVGPPPMV